MKTNVQVSPELPPEVVEQLQVKDTRARKVVRDNGIERKQYGVRRIADARHRTRKNGVERLGNHFHRGIISLVRDTQKAQRNDLVEEILYQEDTIYGELEFLQTEYGATPEEAGIVLQAFYNSGDMSRYTSFNLLKRDFPEYSVKELVFALLALPGEEEVREAISRHQKIPEGMRTELPLYTVINNVLEGDEIITLYDSGEQPSQPEEVSTFFGALDNPLGDDARQEIASLVMYANRDPREQEKTVTDNDPNLRAHVPSVMEGRPLSLEDQIPELHKLGIHMPGE